MSQYDGAEDNMHDDYEYDNDNTYLDYGDPDAADDDDDDHREVGRIEGSRAISSDDVSGSSQLSSPPARYKGFVYIRVQTSDVMDKLLDKGLGEYTESFGTVMVIVPEFTQEWKDRADDCYTGMFGLSLSDLKEVNSTAGLAQDLIIPAQEYLDCQTARAMLLEQDYQFAAEIQGDLNFASPAYNHDDKSMGYAVVEETDGKNPNYPDITQWAEGVRLLKATSYHFSHEGETDSQTGEKLWISNSDVRTGEPRACDLIRPIHPNWEGRFCVIPADLSPGDIRDAVRQHMASGKPALCAIPFEVGSIVLTVDERGQLAAIRIGIGEIVELDIYETFANMRAWVEEVGRNEIKAGTKTRDDLHMLGQL